MRTVAGTRGLIRLILRRDRWMVPPFYLVLLIAVVSFYSSFKKLYPTAGERAHYAHTSQDNGGFTTLYGRLNGASLGDLVAWRSGFVPVLIALVSLLVMIRHTRTEEEAGRRELLGATVVGRHAPLTAAFSATCVVDTVFGLLVALALKGQGLPGGGSLALGLECAGAGVVFAGVGAVAAQLTSSARGAWAISGVVLGAAFLLRVAGDLSAESSGAVSWLTWVSPIGWVQQIRPYAGERWWLLLVVVAAAGALLTAAFALSNRRTLGSGVLPERAGRAEAAPSLRSPLALAARLHLGVMWGWFAGFVVLGAVLGSLAHGIGDMIDDNHDLQKVFARTGGSSGLVDSYLATVMGILGIFAAGYAIQATLRLRAEESSGRAEPVLATPVGRLQWVAGHLLFSLLGPVLAIAGAGAAAGLVHGINSDDVGGQLPRVFGAAMAEVPAVLVLAGVTIALFGLVPRMSSLAWGALVLCLFFGLVGAAVQLNHWLLDISPFTHVPNLPGGSVSALPLVVLSAVAVAVAGVGLAGFRQRPVGD